MKKFLIVVAVLLFIAGCSGPWLKVGGPFTSESQNYMVDLPNAWMRFNNEKNLLITRDGIGLQRIFIFAIDITKKGQQFKYTKKRVTKEMLPQEVAEVLIDNYQSNPDEPFEKVEDNSPATLAGKPGYRLQIVYRTKAGLRYRLLGYGLISSDRLYQITYIAPVRYYFDKDSGTFETVVRSFRLTK